MKNLTNPKTNSKSSDFIIRGVYDLHHRYELNNNSTFSVNECNLSIHSKEYIMNLFDKFNKLNLNILSIVLTKDTIKFIVSKNKYEQKSCKNIKSNFIYGEPNLTNKLEQISDKYAIYHLNSNITKINLYGIESSTTMNLENLLEWFLNRDGRKLIILENDNLIIVDEFMNNPKENILYDLYYHIKENYQIKNI